MTLKMPQFHDFFNPVLQALRDLGGSGTVDEIVEAVVRLMALPEYIAEAPHLDTGRTEVAYRIAWARTYLKKDGLIDNSERAVWSLTEKGRDAGLVDPDAVKRRVRAMRPRDPEPAVADEPDAPELIATDAPEEVADAKWENQLLALIRSIDPAAFERLCQRILRESGFIEVEVTGRSGDGGIDGRGVLRLNGLISFTVMFQSKRYADAVGPNVVRDFRGALVGRADKGLIITTGRFTQEARKEATRDGAPPIDLIDGDLLVRKLKDLGLGVQTRMVEQVEISDEWFAKI